MSTYSAPRVTSALVADSSTWPPTTAEAGATELWLHTGEAARFYERCGYQVARPKTSLVEDAVLWRPLS